MTPADLTPRSATPIATPVNPTPPVPKKAPFFKTPLFLGLSIGILFTSGLAYAYYYSSKPHLLPTQPDIPTPTAKPTSDSPTSTPAITPTFGDFGQITWLDNPTKVNFSDVFGITQPENNEALSYFSFYQLGRFANQAKIFVINELGPGGGYPVFYAINHLPDKTIYYVLPKTQNEVPSSVKDLKNIVDLKPIQLNQPLEFISPETVVGNDLTYKLLFDSGLVITDYPDAKKMFDSPNGSMYQNTSSVNSWLFRKNYIFKSPNGLVAFYQFNRETLTSDSRQPFISWTDNRPAAKYEQSIGVGCGSIGGSVTFIKDSSSVLSDKISVGSASNGRHVYQVKNPDNELVKYLYDQYLVGRDQPYPSQAPTLSLNDFAQTPNHYLWQDPFGDWLVFANENYHGLAECGKPVIYLYPEHDQQVTVRVGANITVSEPLYPTEGWTVLAHPDGQLDYQGRTYPNLFWEGTGWGPYPNYQNRGVVVAQKDLVSTLYRQLSQLGLNQQESADFMDFWQSRLPASAYVRLTWLLTDDMDQLAPLSVSPRPNTSIRIFLEFQGLNQPIPLIPQKLSAPTRTGFTLIEWGGLLIKN